MPRKNLKKNLFKKSSKKDAHVEEIVKAAIDKKAEVKRWQWAQSSQVLTAYANSILFDANNVIDLGPGIVKSMVQGTGNSDRIGNSIRVKKALLSMVIFPATYNASVNANPVPQDVRFMILHSRATPTDTIVSSTFFDSNNTTISPQDTIDDQLFAVNRDIYTVGMDKQYKCGFASFEGTGASAGSQNFTSNDYKQNILLNLDVTKHFPKNIRWNDVSTTPTSFQPVLVILVSRADGSTTGATNYQPLRYSANLTLDYTDM